MLKKYFVLLSIFLISLPVFSRELEKYFREGNSYYKEKKYDEAIISYKNALKFSPDSPEINYNIGVCYLGKGSNYYEIAKKWFKKAIELNPKLSSGYYNLGYICLEQKNYEEAIIFFKKAKELNPKDEPTQIALRKAENLKKKSEEVDQQEKNIEKEKEIKKTTPEVSKETPQKKESEKKQTVKIEKSLKETETSEIKGEASSYIRRVIFCKDVVDRKPQEITSEFLTSDEKVVIFIEIYKLSGKHSLGIDWYTPSGKLYATYIQEISPSGERYRIWGYRKIKGYPAENFKGTWKVKIYLDKKFAKEEKFKIK